MGNRVLDCTFIKKKADKFIVDINVDGINVKDVLIRDEYLSELAEGLYFL